MAAGKNSRTTRRRPARKTSGTEIQGRADESLPSREKAVIGVRDWQREDGAVSPSSVHQDQIIEIEYERGPGSRYQIEGRGIPRSKRKHSK